MAPFLSICSSTVILGRVLSARQSCSTALLGLSVLESIIFLVFLKVTYEAIVEDSGVGDFVLGGTTPTGKWEPRN